MLIDKLCSFSFDRLLTAISVQSTIRAPYDYIIYVLRAVYPNQKKQRILIDTVIMIRLGDQQYGVRSQAEAEVTLFPTVSRPALGPNQFPI
jgi:hypothetical protein